MKIKLKLFYTLLTISYLSFSQSANKNFIDQPYIEVTGTIETEITPNEIYLNIVLSENDNKGKISIEDQENQMINVLKVLGINLEKSFSVLDFNGYYKRKFLADNEVTKTKRYELIINDGKTLREIYQALDKINISNVSITKTSHSDIEKIRRETKLKALKMAKEKANQYAIAINQVIGKAIFIQEQSSININGLLGNANGINVRGYSSSHDYKSEYQKIQDLNLKKIIVSASILTKFILN